MTQLDFAQLPFALQTNLLFAVSLCEALRYWLPAGTTAAEIAQLDAVVWATAAGCVRMFEAGGSDWQGTGNYERLIAAVPDNWRQAASDSSGAV